MYYSSQCQVYCNVSANKGHCVINQFIKQRHEVVISEYYNQVTTVNVKASS
jgi:hypothetical protein